MNDYSSSRNGGGGNSSLNIIRNMSYKIYNDVILTGTLNGTISSSSFNWNRIDSVFANLQNNLNDLCFILTSSKLYHLSKDSTTHNNGLPYGIRLIIEYKE